MNVKYKKYIEYIARDIELPYIKSLEPYGLKQDDYHLVLSKVFNQPVLVRNNHVYEDSEGDWNNRVYDNNNNEIYREYSDGVWIKREYDTNGSLIYVETSNGVIRDNRYERQV